MTFCDCMTRCAGEYGIKLDSGQLRKFGIYYELLMEWNNKMNLTAITAPEEVAVKHMVDSLSAWNDGSFARNARIIDVGTGAGFPGLPLKIMYPELRLTLLDSLNKRISFLQKVSDELELPEVELIHGRAEELGRQKKYREKFDVAFSRAVARMSVLCEYALPFVKIGGYFTALKGRQYEQELSESENALRILEASLEEIKPVKLPGIDDIRAIIYIRKTGRTPAAYPRRAGSPERKPL